MLVDKKEILAHLEVLKFNLPGGQAGIAFEYFLDRPNLEVHHDDVVPWIIGMYQTRFQKACKDPDRAIRKLHDMGLLQKVGKGIYCFAPYKVINNELFDFDEATKKAVKDRDNWKCVVCGKGLAEGVELQVDHIKPRSMGGDGSLENGQTLCGSHNYRKNNLDQITMGADMFKRLMKSAQKSSEENPSESQKVIDFCSKVLSIYAEFDYEI
jgi:hypothetical protein